MTDETPQDRVEEGVPAAAAAVPTKTPPANFGLSVVSKQYDIDGDGKLDEAEKAMRDMDATGQGHLTNQQVYKIMTEHLDTQRELFKVKKIVIGLVVFVAILALSNLGTSFAAAYLAKDTTTNSNSELVDTKTERILSTQTASDYYPVDPVYDGQFSRKLNGQQRELCTTTSKFNLTCATASYLSMDASTATTLIDKCKRGNEVRIEREFTKANRVLSKKICSDFTDALFNGRKKPASATFTYANKEQVIIEPNGANYRLYGNYLLQDEGAICDETDDCDEGLECNSSNVCATPSLPAVTVGMYGTCNDVDLVCGTGLACYIPETCFAPPCTGTCNCADDSGCTSSPSLCMEDFTNLLGTDPATKADIYGKRCGCEIGTTNGCENDANNPVCVGGMMGGVCGCGSDADCGDGMTCYSDPMIPDMTATCTPGPVSLPAAGINQACDEVTMTCQDGLACYIPDGSAEGTCNCATDDVCTSPSVCVDDPMVWLGTDPDTRGDILRKTCGCEIGTTNGCSDPSSPVCVSGMIGGVCGCNTDADCGDLRCIIDEMIADIPGYCG